MLRLGLFLLLLLPPIAEASIKTDIKFVACDVCKRAMDQLYHASQGAGEEAILDLAANVCDPAKDEGEWLKKIDIRQRTRYLELHDQDGAAARCGNECQTLKRACARVVDEHESEISEALYRGDVETLKALQRLACKTLSGVCSVKWKTPEGYRFNDESFQTADQARASEAKKRASEARKRAKADARKRRNDAEAAGNDWNVSKLSRLWDAFRSNVADYARDAGLVRTACTALALLLALHGLAGKLCPDRSDKARRAREQREERDAKRLAALHRKASAAEERRRRATEAKAAEALRSLKAAADDDVSSEECDSDGVMDM
jgi:hypothetical protein